MGVQPGAGVGQAGFEQELLARQLQHGLGHAVGLGGGRVGAQLVVEGGVGRQAFFLEGFIEEGCGAKLKLLQLGPHVFANGATLHTGQPERYQVVAQHVDRLRPAGCFNCQARQPFAEHVVFLNATPLGRRAQAQNATDLGDGNVDGVVIGPHSRQAIIVELHFFLNGYLHHRPRRKG